MELSELTEEQWVEIAFRLIFNLHPYPAVAPVMGIDRIRSEEFGMAIERFGGIVALVESLVRDNGIPIATRQALSEMMVSSKDENELKERFSALQRRDAADAFIQDNPHFVWSRLPGE